MKKNLSKIYTIVVIIALLVLGAWSTWDIYQLRTSNTEAAKMNIDEIKKVIEDTRIKGIPFNDKDFFTVVRNLFSENPELEILTIYSHDEDVGIEYHYNKGEEIELLNLSESSPLSMKELPEYKYNQLMKTRLSGTLNGTGQTGLDLDLIYQVVDRNVIYNILIRVLIVVVVLFFTTLLMIFAMSRNKVAEIDIDEDDFDVKEDDISSEDDMSLDWDENGFEDNLQGESEDNEPDFGDLSLDNDEFADMDLNETGGEFDDLNLDGEDSADFGDLSLDSESESDDFGDMNFDSENEVDDMTFDDVSDDFGDFNPDSDLETEETDDFSDIDMDSDIPEEEDLLAMDHEISPSSEIDDFDFDNMEDSLSDDFPSKDDLPSKDAPSLYSPKSGLGWEDFIEERVNLELERAAANDNDLVMGLIQCDSLTEDNYRIFADQLKEDFNYPDMIFEYKEKGFALIVPSTDLDSAIETLEMFTGKEQDQYGSINVGISSRNGRLLSGSRIFMEAENALHKAVADEEKNIVGFRSDPDKFREYLSDQS